MGKLLKIILKTMELGFVVFLIYLGSLFFREERVSGAVVTDFVQRYLPDSFRVAFGECTFGFREGFVVRDIRVWDMDRADRLTPMATVERLTFNPLTRELTALHATYDRLPDSYYQPTYSFADKTKDGPIPEEPITFRFPKIPRLHVTLEEPRILGVQPEQVSTTLAFTPARVTCEEICILWHEREGFLTPMELHGETYVDLEEQVLKGGVRGHAIQPQIRPLLGCLDVPCAFPYFDAFTEVKGPVESYCGWYTHFPSGKFDLDLDLEPPMGFYQGVPMRTVKGVLQIHVRFHDGHMWYDTVIGPLEAYDLEKRYFGGRMIAHGGDRRDMLMLEFDAASDLPLRDTLSVIDTLNHGTLDCLQCETAPHLTIKGFLSPDIDRQYRNDAGGEIRFEKGSLFGVKLREARADWQYKGTDAIFTNATAKGAQGGTLAGWGVLHVPGCVVTNASFDIAVSYRNGRVQELAELLDLNVGERYGEMEGDIRLSGPMGTNAVRQLDGSGRLTVKNGHLAQMRLFAGLTEALAEYVPGVAAIVNQNTLSCDFEIEDGVVETTNLLIEGTVFSFSTEVRADLVTHALSGRVLVTFTRKDSVLGSYFLRPILWPFTRLLLEYRLSGTFEKPTWEYVSILDRL